MAHPCLVVHSRFRLQIVKERLLVRCDIVVDHLQVDVAVVVSPEVVRDHEVHVEVVVEDVEVVEVVVVDTEAGFPVTVVAVVVTTGDPQDPDPRANPNHLRRDAAEARVLQNEDRCQSLALAPSPLQDLSPSHDKSVSVDR